MAFSEFKVPFGSQSLACDWCGNPSSNPLVILHGAGKGTRERFIPLREKLGAGGYSSLALDFVGHGYTGGELSDSSLESRTSQVCALLKNSNIAPPLNLLGSSMGAYNAIKLCEAFTVTSLILMVPGVYTPSAYSVKFGPRFSNVIRERNSWVASDAWSILSRFTGNLLVLGAEKDTVIPQEIPQRLFDAATHARSRDLVWVPNSPHLLIQYLNEDIATFDEVVNRIRLVLKGGV